MVAGEARIVVPRGRRWDYFFADGIGVSDDSGLDSRRRDRKLSEEFERVVGLRVEDWSVR